MSFTTSQDSMILPRREGSRLVRRVLELLGVFLLSLSLSGCFVIPLADGRSPFDNPFGNSNAKIKSNASKLQEILDSAGLNPDFVYTAGKVAENCEGECNLTLGVYVSVSPSSLEEFLSEVPDLQVLEESSVDSVVTDGSLYVKVMLPPEVREAVEVIGGEYEALSGIPVSVRLDYSDPLTMPGLLFHIPGENQFIKNYYRSVVFGLR